jgi:hypothetical protein
MYNTYSVSTIIVVRRTHPDGTFLHTLPTLLHLNSWPCLYPMNRSRVAQDGSINWCERYHCVQKYLSTTQLCFMLKQPEREPIYFSPSWFQLKYLWICTSLLNALMAWCFKGMHHLTCQAISAKHFHRHRCDIGPTPLRYESNKTVGEWRYVMQRRTGA